MASFDSISSALFPFSVWFCAPEIKELSWKLATTFIYSPVLVSYDLFVSDMVGTCVPASLLSKANADLLNEDPCIPTTAPDLFR